MTCGFEPRVCFGSPSWAAPGRGLRRCRRRDGGAEPRPAPVDAAGWPPDVSSRSEDAAGAALDAGGSGLRRDVFGIRMLYPTRTRGAVWDSSHWADGRARTASASRERDVRDETGWSALRGSGLRSPGMVIDGWGVATLRGNQPRLYLDGTEDGVFWRNVEITMYYRRDRDDGAPTGGAVLGARSGPEGHAGAPCTATTYYARLRHDGRQQFLKELSHPLAASVVGDRLLPGGVPRDRWIGLKFVVYNLPDGAVRLEHYVDWSGGVDGGEFERVGILEDRGEWFVEQDSACVRDNRHVIVDGGGVVFIRNTLGAVGQADYRWVSVREIEPPGAAP